MKYVKYILLGVILGILGGYLYTLLYPNIIIEEKVEIKYKYVEKTVYLDAPKIRSFILPEDTLFIPADTAELIARYRNLWLSHNTRNLYRDTLTFDTLGYAVIDQQVFRNTLDSMKYEYSLKIPEKTITRIVYPKNNFYIGGLIGKEKLAPAVMYTRSGKYNFFVDYNLINNSVSGGVLVKIK